MRWWLLCLLVLGANRLMGNELMNAVTQGKLVVDMRLRWEHVDFEWVEDQSSAVTLRSRLGW